MKKKPDPTETAPATCETCRHKFDRPVFLFNGKEVFRVRECPECNTRREREYLAVQNQKRQRALAKTTQEFVPSRYRNFDRWLLPIAGEKIDAVLNWRPKPSPDARNSARILPPSRLPMTDETIEQILNSRPSPSADGRGLALPGPPHIGKRRLLFGLGDNLFYAGFQIAHISAPDFESKAQLQFDRETGASVRRELRQLRSVEILILTDVGAEKLTESSQREFYGLVEHRAQRCLPILWTTQFSKEQVAARFVTKDAPAVALARGRAAVERLNEISDVIQLERESFGETATRARSA
jgi:hypothetical protein